MADLTLRVVTALPPTGSLYTTKNAALTFFEIDNNFVELDSEIHTLENRLPEVSVTTPNIAPGKIWYNPDTDRTYIYNDINSVWEEIGVYNEPEVNTVAPASPDPGKIWYDSTTGDTTIWDGGQWVSVSGSGVTVASTAPTAPKVGDQWYDLTTGDMFLWDGSQWLDISGTKIIDGLIDVIGVGVLPGQILEWDPTATDSDGRVGQWVATYTLDASPDGGTTDDF